MDSDQPIECIVLEEDRLLAFVVVGPGSYQIVPGVIVESEAPTAKVLDANDLLIVIQSKLIAADLTKGVDDMGPGETAGRVVLVLDPSGAAISVVEEGFAAQPQSLVRIMMASAIGEKGQSQLAVGLVFKTRHLIVFVGHAYDLAVSIDGESITLATRQRGFDQVAS